MTQTAYAADELSLWEEALREQRQAERELEMARKNGRRRRVVELIPQVQALTTRADLLLAEAVHVKCTFRDDSIATAWVSSTQSGLEAGDGQ
jgi:hypothetical protein